MSMQRSFFAVVTIGCIAMAGCNSVEPYPATWHAAGLWEVTYDSIHMEARYSDSEPTQSSPSASAFPLGTIMTNIMHLPGETTALLDGTVPLTVDPLMGTAVGSQVGVDQMLSPNCRVHSENLYTFVFARDRFTAQLTPVLNITFENVGSSIGCATYFDAQAIYFRMNGAFPAGYYTNLVTFVYGGAVNVSNLNQLRSLHLTIDATMINTTPSEELGRASASGSSFSESMLRELAESSMERVVRTGRDAFGRPL